MFFLKFLYSNYILPIPNRITKLIIHNPTESLFFSLRSSNHIRHFQFLVPHCLARTFAKSSFILHAFPSCPAVCPQIFTKYFPLFSVVCTENAHKKWRKKNISGCKRRKKAGQPVCLGVLFWNLLMKLIGLGLLFGLCPGDPVVLGLGASSNRGRRFDKCPTTFGYRVRVFPLIFPLSPVAIPLKVGQSPPFFQCFVYAKNHRGPLGNVAKISGNSLFADTINLCVSLRWLSEYI